MSSKPHLPSEKALRRAMEEGDVPLSALLSGAAAILLLCLLAQWAASKVVRQFEENLRHAAESASQAAPSLSVEQMIPFANAASETLILLLAFAALALVVGGVQTRGWFSLKPLAPRAQRLQPSARFLSAETGRSLLVGTAAILVALTVATTVWLSSSRGIAALSVAEPETALQSMAQSVRLVLFWSGGILFVIGLGDLLLARLLHRNRHRMSDQELNREKREAEGHQAQKQERTRQFQLAQQDAPKPTLWICGPRGAVGVITEKGAPSVVARQRKRPRDANSVDSPALVVQLWGRVGKPIPRKLYGPLARAHRQASTHER